MASSSLDTLPETPAVELRRLIGARQLSPVELLEASIRRIIALNPATNAITGADVAEARRVARLAEQAVLRGDELGLALLGSAGAFAGVGCFLLVVGEGGRAGELVADQFKQALTEFGRPTTVVSTPMAGLPDRLKAALAAHPDVGEIWLRSPGGDARAGNDTSGRACKYRQVDNRTTWPRTLAPERNVR